MEKKRWVKIFLGITKNHSHKWEEKDKKKKYNFKFMQIGFFFSLFFSSSLRNIYKKKLKYFLSFFYFIHPIKQTLRSIS